MAPVALGVTGAGIGRATGGGLPPCQNASTAAATTATTAPAAMTGRIDRSAAPRPGAGRLGGTAPGTTGV